MKIAIAALDGANAVMVYGAILSIATGFAVIAIMILLDPYQ